jgi:hypothetical protein
MHFRNEFELDLMVALTITNFTRLSLPLFISLFAQVKDWAAGPRNTKLCTARPGWQTMSLRIGKYKTSKDYTRIKLGKSVIFSYFF